MTITINRTAWFIIILVLVTALPGYIISWRKQTKINELKTELIMAEFEKFKGIHAAKDSLNKLNVITLNDIKARQEEFEKVETELRKSISKEMSIEQALEIINKQ